MIDGENISFGDPMRLHMGLVYQFRRRFKVLYALDPGCGESRFVRGEKKARAKRASMTE